MDDRLNIAPQQVDDQAIKTIDEANDISRNPPTVAVSEKKLVLAFSIIPFAIAGALIRIGLQRLETYDGSPVFGLAYAQWLGCLIMGVVTFHKNNLFLFYHPLHVGLSTGLCGSITTFSSWQYGIFSGFANIDGALHTRGKNVLAGLSECLVTLAMAFSGYHCGHHIARLLEHIGLFSPMLQRLADQQNVTVSPRNNSAVDRDSNKALSNCPVPKVVPCGFALSDLNRIDCLVVGFGTLSWVGVVLAAVFSPDDHRELALTCAFAPVGALLRWYLSFFNGTIRKDTFVGTLAANIFGTLVLAVIYSVRFGAYLSPVSCSVLAALADGFCGKTD